MKRGLHPPISWFVALSFVLASCTTDDGVTRDATLQEQVFATETAFAETMADRDFDAFKRFIAEEAVFFSGDTALRGKNAVISVWRRYFEGDAAPFSWRPASVVVLESGDLAFSTGPVHDASGNTIATFNSVWRRQADGRWLVVFDKGCSTCQAPAPGADR